MAPDPARSDGAAAGGTVLTESVLVVQYRADSIEGGDEYLIHDQRGRRLAAVRYVRRYELQLVGADGAVVLGVKSVRERPTIVTDAAGCEVGRIVQENVFGRARFALRSGDRRWGSVNAEDLRGWNFDVLDEAGAEVARITRTWEGLAEALVMGGNDHVLQIRRRLRDPLRMLVVAAAFVVPMAAVATG